MRHLHDRHGDEFHATQLHSECNLMELVQNSDAVLASAAKEQVELVRHAEACIAELQAEIEGLHEITREKHGHDNVLESYIKKIKEKDKLIY